jgi:simple sugar transport system substrate-binding protein
MRSVVAVLALLALAGCGRAPVSVREPDVVVHGDQAVRARPTPDQQSRGLRITSTRIAVVTHGQASDPIWAVVKRGLEDAARLDNVAVSYRAPDTYDINRMRQMVEDAIADRPDGLVVSLPDANALGPAIEEAERLGIPVVTINSGSDAFKRLGVAAHVGQPEYQAGIAGGERMAAAGARTVLCVDHEVGNQGLSERCRGLAAGLTRRHASAREIDIDLQDPMGAQRTIAQALSEGGIDGIVTLGPTGAVPALAALRASGFEGRVKLATFDLSNDVLRAIKDERILFAIDQQPYLEGYLPIVLLAQRARHGIFPTAGGLIPTGPRFVTSANVDETIRLSREGVR